MSLLYYVSICSFVFFVFLLPFHFVRRPSPRNHGAFCFLIGLTATRGVRPALNRTSEHMSERDRLCVLVYRKNVWLLYRLLKTQLNQMSWDCFKLDPWAVCGGCAPPPRTVSLYSASVVHDALKPCVSAKPFKRDSACHCGEQLRHYTIRRRWVTFFSFFNSLFCSRVCWSACISQHRCRRYSVRWSSKEAFLMSSLILVPFFSRFGLFCFVFPMKML